MKTVAQQLDDAARCNRWLKFAADGARIMEGRTGKGHTCTEEYSALFVAGYADEMEKQFQKRFQ